MFLVMKRMVMWSTVTLLLVLGLGVGYYLNQTSSGTNTTGSTKGAINSNTACSAGDWENTSAMNTLRSDLMGQPKFMELAQNRSYYDAGYGCSLVNGTRFTVHFGYSDLAHPFYACGSGTAYPEYFIDAKIFLLPSGYDLGKTAYSTRYYDSQNLTVTCTTAITTTA
jgi:hypothetical protein